MTAHLKIRVVVIALERTPERRGILEERIARIGLDEAFAVEFVAAIDGQTLTQEQIAASTDDEKRRRHFNYPMSLGALGCALSHRREIKRFLDSGDPARLILEDDCDPLPAMRRCAAGIELFHNRVDFINISDRSPASNPVVKVVDFMEGHDICAMRYGDMTMRAYVVTRRGARKYLAANAKIFYENDRVCNRWWESGLKVFTIEPPLDLFHFHPEDSAIEAPRTPWPDMKWREKIMCFINRKIDSFLKRWKFREMRRLYPDENVP